MNEIYYFTQFPFLKQTWAVKRRKRVATRSKYLWEQRKKTSRTGEHILKTNFSRSKILFKMKWRFSEQLYICYIKLLFLHKKMSFSNYVKKWLEYSFQLLLLFFFLSVMRVSQGFWGTREHWQNVEGNKGTLAIFWEQGNKIRKITKGNK